MKRILIVEDEPAIADTILYALKTEGFRPLCCKTCGEAMEKLSSEDIDLMVLDVGLPDGSGFELCKEVRKQRNLPIIFLTARSSEVDRIVGLEIGGDDYIVKPFSPRELSARVKAVLRRSEQGESPSALNSEQWEEIKLGRFSINPLACSICFCNRVLDLTRYEYGILKLLIENPRRVYSRRQIMDLVWEEPEISLERTVDSHIKTLRTKLREIRASCNSIVTHRGMGYSLEEDQ